MISDFCHEVYENCTLLGYYTMSSGIFLTNVLGQPICPVFNGQESRSHCAVTQKSAILVCPHCLDAYITKFYSFVCLYFLLLTIWFEVWFDKGHCHVLISFPLLAWSYELCLCLDLLIWHERRGSSSVGVGHSLLTLHSSVPTLVAPQMLHWNMIFICGMS